jgi:hypothetical protein
MNPQPRMNSKNAANTTLIFAWQKQSHLQENWSEMQ